MVRNERVDRRAGVEKKDDPRERRWKEIELSGAGAVGE